MEAGEDEAAQLAAELGLDSPASARELMTLRDGLNSTAQWAVLVGAGLSRPAGIPGWSDLVHTAANRFGVALPTSDLVDELLPDVFDACLANLEDPAEFWDFIADEICKGDPGATHEYLLQIPFRAFLTINLDCLLKRQHARQFNDIEDPVLVYPNLKPTMISNRRLVHLHGICQDQGQRLDPNAVVLTATNYKVAYGPSRLSDVIKAAFGDYQVFLVGTSLADHQIRHLVRGLRDDDVQMARETGDLAERRDLGFALVANEKGHTPEEFVWTWPGKNVGIRLIGYLNADGTHAAVTEVLRWLAKQTAGVSASSSRFEEADV